MVNLSEKLDNLGAVYTPKLIADYVAGLLLEFQIAEWEEELKNNSTQQKVSIILERLQGLTVLDHACGDASLLCAIEERLCIIQNRFQASLKQKDIVAIKQNIEDKYPGTIGVDIDLNAIEDARENMRECILFTGRVESFTCADSLVPLPGKERLAGWFDQFPHVMNNGGFDLIIANPPWGADTLYGRDELSKAGYKLAVGQYDTYELFLELGLELTINNGYLGFIIPDSIFYLSTKGFASF
jgi:adenine-specific DNA-methyltransferase